MRRYKVTVILEDERDDDYRSAIGGMVDRVLIDEFHDASSDGRPGGYLDMRMVAGCEVEELLSKPCIHCEGKGLAW